MGSIFNKAMTALFAVGSSASRAMTQSSNVEATPQQAKEFIELMSSIHGVAECSDSSGSADSVIKTKDLVSISGNNLTVQEVSGAGTKFSKGATFNSVTIITQTVPIKEITARLYIPKYINRCKPPYVVSFECLHEKSSKMTYRRSSQADAVSVFDQKPIAPNDYEASDSTEAALFYLNEKDVAERIIKAFEFYRAHSPAVQSSPF